MPCTVEAGVFSRDLQRMLHRALLGVQQAPVDCSSCSLLNSLLPPGHLSPNIPCAIWRSFQRPPTPTGHLTPPLANHKVDSFLCMGKPAVAWKSNPQSRVSLSSTEAKVYAASEATKRSHIPAPSIRTSHLPFLTHLQSSDATTL